MLTSWTNFPAVNGMDPIELNIFRCSINAILRSFLRCDSHRGPDTWYIEAWIKWLTSSRRYFQIQLLKREYLYLVKCFLCLKCVGCYTIDKSANVLGNNLAENRRQDNKKTNGRVNWYGYLIMKMSVIIIKRHTCPMTSRFTIKLSNKSILLHNELCFAWFYTKPCRYSQAVLSVMYTYFSLTEFVLYEIESNRNRTQLNFTGISNRKPEHEFTAYLALNGQMRVDMFSLMMCAVEYHGRRISGIRYIFLDSRFKIQTSFIPWKYRYSYLHHYNGHTKHVFEWQYNIIWRLSLRH